MKLTHIDEKGNANMVDVSEKNISLRIAKAKGTIMVNPDLIEKIKNHSLSKGDVLTVAQLAGIMASKKTPDIIPLCHPIKTTGCKVTFEVKDDRIEATATVKAMDKTGVEMEALHAVSASLLTIYDMIKAVDKSMVITDIHLLEKSGGKSGNFLYGN